MRTYDRVDIGGEWRRPTDKATVDVVDPSTEAVVARIPKTTEIDVNDAVAAARHALDRSSWNSAARAERAEAVLAFADLLDERIGDLATLLSEEMGQPLLISHGLHANAAPMVRDFVDHAASVPIEQTRVGARGPALVRRDPVGVVAAIVPYNGPLFVMLVKLIPALLGGCSVVVKPPPEAPSACLELVDLLREAGLPHGVVSILPGDGVVGECLVRHPGVDMVTFTGSTAAGRRIGAHCGETFKRMTLELGGKSAAIVLDDADIDVVVPNMLMGAFGNSGQVCVSLSRLVVSDERHDEVVEAIGRAASQLAIGPAVEPITIIGPLVSARQRDKVERYVQGAETEGAKIAYGGGRPAHLDKGWFFEPTILTDVDNDMTIAREEVFGPVLSVIRYDGDDAHAIRIANESEYGLHGAVFTADRERGLRIAEQVRSGTFTVNGYVLNDVAPFGGVKASGVGREFGPEGLDAYVEYKTINVPGDGELAAAH